jgi:hypothetical protein
MPAPQYAGIAQAPIFYSMAAFCMLFAIFQHYVGRNVMIRSDLSTDDSLGFINLQAKRSVSSIH